MHRIIFILVFFSLNTEAGDGITPKNDMAILHLSQASMICEVLKEVNPQSIRSPFIGNENHFFMAARLYSIFHEMAYEEAEGHQQGWYDLLTSESVIKAQSLRSNTGAQAYLARYLDRTDARNCNDIRSVANRILSIYRYEL
jgi:hypothetical protein